MTGTLRFPKICPSNVLCHVLTLHYIPPLLLFLVIIVVRLLCLI